MAVFDRLHCEEPDKIEVVFVDSVEHLVNIHTVLFSWEDEVYCPEKISFHNVDVANVLPQRDNEPCLTFKDKVNLDNHVGLVVDLLIHWNEKLLQ